MTPNPTPPTFSPASSKTQPSFWTRLWALQDAYEWIPFCTFLAALVAFNSSEWSRTLHQEVWSSYSTKDEIAAALEGYAGTVMLGVYFGLYFTFALIDALQPSWLMRRRIQSHRPPPTLGTSLRTIFWGAVLNIPVDMAVNALVVSPVWRWRVGVEKVTRVPSAWECVVEFVALQVLNDVVFYWTHRLMHTKYLYHRFHKVHHTNSSVFAAAANYLHPIETLLSISPLSGVPVILVVPYPQVMWFNQLWRGYESATAHCGYDVSGVVPNARWHDWHHRAFDGNYGFSATIDHIFGTLHPQYVAWLQDHQQTFERIDVDVDVDSSGPMKADEAPATSTSTSARRNAWSDDVPDPYAESGVKEE
ncbi:hypothetical protein M427DRAFT_55699 [Gonapodya prolifera JEL478]|uniref:Fatty acid hydroxylase domain-containing protein n=1 Tax=Gonapodya prolifera (strain JEL478) TaxID=1344416 RepID=A0A139AHV0_GONPJ|nr:hypothetical protein M427DRAFT_55699 [Gonapodya prolifera JEL478]|eukprot:KXS16269.1 hypothetical protein M427DRAFT_55699 [Gonapodya prolifera JEL478]